MMNTNASRYIRNSQFVDTAKGNGIANPSVEDRVSKISAWVMDKDSGDWHLILHNTVIVSSTKDGVILNSGGWRTLTTKNYMNMGLRETSHAKGYMVHQDRGVWYVGKGWNDHSHVFANGMMIKYGEVSYPSGKPPDPKATLKLQREIRKYAKGYAQAFVGGEVPKPSSGDCFYCHMAFTDEDGDMVDPSADHLLSHVEEQYYVPSLLHRAAEEYGDTTMCLYAKSVIYAWWYMGRHEEGAWLRSITKRDIERCIVKYLRHHLEIAG